MEYYVAVNRVPLAQSARLCKLEKKYPSPLVK